MMDELLSTLKKTEDSLRRLNKGRSSKDGPSDEDKVRKQLAIDIAAYRSQVSVLEIFLCISS